MPCCKMRTCMASALACEFECVTGGPPYWQISGGTSCIGIFVWLPAGGWGVGVVGRGRGVTEISSSLRLWAEVPQQLLKLGEKKMQQIQVVQPVSSNQKSRVVRHLLSVVTAVVQ